MSKRSSRFVANAELWSVLRDHVRKAEGVRAAVAYFGRNGAKLLPLKKGDIIIVDVSLGAVRQGVTDPRALRTLTETHQSLCELARKQEHLLVLQSSLAFGAVQASAVWL